MSQESPAKKQCTGEAPTTACTDTDWSSYKPKLTDSHKWLQTQEGYYTAKITCYLKAGDEANPMVSDGYAIYKSWGNGMFLEGKWFIKDDKGKISMEGRELIGFDSRKGEFYCIWNDTFCDFPCPSRGKEDSEKDIILMHGSCDDPMNGKLDQPFKQIIDKKTGTLSMYKKKDDNDTEITGISMKVEKVKIPGPDSISFFTLLVKDYDEALKWYTEKLGFRVETDVPMGADERWITLQAQSDATFKLNIYKPKDAADIAKIGKQGSFAFFYLASSDCQRDYELLKSRGVEFTSPPKDQFYGIDASFKDLYGNGIGLCQVKPH